MKLAQLADVAGRKWLLVRLAGRRLAVDFEMD